MLENLNNFNFIKYKKGTVIFHEGTTCKYACFVKDGIVRIVSHLINGNEIQFNRIKNGGVFGDMLLFSNNPIYQGDVIAETDVELYLFNKNDILNLLTSDRNFLINYLERISENGKKAKNDIKILTFKSVDDRLMFLLDINQGKIKYKTISDLANKLFVSRESLSRAIHKLEKDKVIVLNGKNIILVDN